MLRHAKPFTARQVNSLSPGIRADGGCLYLNVSGKSARSYVLRYLGSDGRRHDFGIGSTGKITLAQAREKARNWLSKIADGADPIDARRKERQGRQVTRVTFGEKRVERRGRNRSA